MNSSEALAMDSKSKTHLVRLRLKWNKHHIPDYPRKEKEVLEILQPPNTWSVCQSGTPVPQNSQVGIRLFITKFGVLTVGGL